MIITVTGNNSKLPKVYITKAILQNDSISISLDIEEGTESGVNNFSNNDYFEYLKFDIVLFGTSIIASNTVQINELPATIRLSFTDIDTSGLLSINIRTYFESDRYVSDNNITDRSLVSLVYNILGSSVVIDYPVLDSNGDLYFNLLDVNGDTVASVVSDYRSVTELENLNLISPSSIREDKPKYFNFVKSDVVGTKVNNFVSFNYRKFLQNNSFFSSSDFENYNIQITISNSLKSLENLIINNNKFLSSSINTKLISKSNETILFYFEDNSVTDVEEYITTYSFQVSYVDEDFSTFYNLNDRTGTFFEVYEQYYQFKNIIFLAQTFADYPTNPNIKEPFYLDTTTDRFTNEFVSFCERTQIDSKKIINGRISTIKIPFDLRSIIENIISKVINLFLSAEDQISSETINKIVSCLQFDVSTFSLYMSFFKTIDQIFLDLQTNQLNKINLVTKFYTKNYNIKEKVNTSFFLIDDINNNSIPKLQISKMQDIINRYNTTTNTVRPKFISNNKEKNEITDNLEFDSTTFSHISSFAKALQDNKKLNLSTQLITEESYLEKLGVTLSVGYLESSNTITSFDKTETFRTNLASTAKKGLKSNSLTLQDISKADQNIKSKIKQTNQFSHALNFSKFKEKATKEEMTPKLYLFYYNEEVDGYWSKLTKLTTLMDNMLIKIEKDLEEENIFTKAEVSSKNVPLENSYFIITEK